MIIPAIDLIDGSVVRLFQGDYKQTTEYQQDAEQLALHYAEQGAELLHLVDLSGAKDPTKRQHELIGRIARSVDNPVQAGGGIREERQIADYLEAGLERVVIGSLAVREPALVKAWVTTYGPDAIVLALDINIDQEGRRLVATHGWQTDSGVEIESLLDDYLSVGARHILCTDISRDGTLQGPNAELYAALSARYPALRIQASGGVGGLNDVASVKGKADGVIVGRALLEGRFTLQEAIACWRDA